MSNYLTFASASAFSVATDAKSKTWDGALYYSTNVETWTEWDGTTAIESAEHDGEQRVYMRGIGNTVITGDEVHEWVLTGSDIKCIGNIENLLDYEVVKNGEHPTMAMYCFKCMFYDCTALTSAPELPATTLSNHCYCSMFTGCVGLTNVPELPAAKLKAYCYYGMFQGCTGLTIPPDLPATNIAGLGVYMYMFADCTGIKLSDVQDDKYTIPYRIPPVGDAESAYSSIITTGMFSGTGGTFKGNPELNTTYYLYAPVPVDPPAVAPEVEPKAFMAGWRMGQLVRGMRG